MKIRSSLLAAAVAAGLLAVVPASADNASGTSDVVVSVIDTGARATHQEFNYGGPTDTTDQFVGWWDFSEETTPHLEPAPGQLWDTRVADPFDNNGHGTATASAAVGLNKSPLKEKSLAPGFKLAVAKVGEGDGAVSGDIAAALRWSVDTVGADVVNISIGPQIPVPASIYDIDETIEYARSRGVLVVVSNGNGFLNRGIPGDPGWANPFSVTEALSVGAAGITNGATTTTDPEVSAKFTQRLASKTCNTCYANITGTSFSAPLVAGMAAKLMEVALANGRSASPNYIETLLKYSARDTDTPPNFEGYGTLDQAAFNTSASPNAIAGTLPSRPDPDVSGTYVETVANGLRDLWNKDLDEGSLGLALSRSFTPLPVNGKAGAGNIGTSGPAGLADGEVYQATLAPGETLTFDLEYTNYTVPTVDVDGFILGIDVDVYVFKGTGPFTSAEQVDISGEGAGVAESISYTSATGGTYSVLVIGWIVGDSVTFSTSGNAAFASEGYYAVRSLVLI